MQLDEVAADGECEWEYPSEEHHEDICEWEEREGSRGNNG